MPAPRLRWSLLSPVILHGEVARIATSRDAKAAFGEELARILDHLRIAAQHDTRAVVVEADAEVFLQDAAREELGHAVAQRPRHRLARDETRIAQLVGVFRVVLAPLEAADE